MHTGLCAHGDGRVEGSVSNASQSWTKSRARTLRDRAVCPDSQYIAQARMVRRRVGSAGGCLLCAAAMRSLELIDPPGCRSVAKSPTAGGKAAVQLKLTNKEKEEHTHMSAEEIEILEADKIRRPTGTPDAVRTGLSQSLESSRPELSGSTHGGWYFAKGVWRDAWKGGPSSRTSFEAESATES